MDGVPGPQSGRRRRTLPEGKEKMFFLTDGKRKKQCRFKDMIRKKQKQIIK